MGKEAFDRKIAAIEALRAAPDAEVVTGQLRTALKDRSGFLVSKAAAVAGARNLTMLAPDLVGAFDRLLADPHKSDPQCWGKNAIAKALKDIGHDDPDVFLRGIGHIQLEPVWGGVEDTAATLRGTCALALTQCRGITELDILERLTGLLADKETPARVDAARAIAQLGKAEGALLLTLKILNGDPEPEVIGECFSSLISLRPQTSLGFVARYLDSDDPDVRIEAATALGESRETDAFTLLRERWERTADRELKAVLLRSIGMLRQDQAVPFLTAVIASGNTRDGVTAIVALAPHKSRSEVHAQVADAVRSAGDEELSAAFQREFGIVAN